MKNFIKSKLPKNYPLYEVGYSNDLPVEQLYYELFSMIPSSFNNTSCFYSPDIVEYFKKTGFEIFAKIIDNNSYDDLERRQKTYMINEKKELLVCVFSSPHWLKSDLNVKVTFHFNYYNGEFEEQFNYEEILKKFKKEKYKSPINLVIKSQRGLERQPYNLLKPTINLKRSYGENFLKIHEHIVESLNKEFGKGIVLLHGEPGTGKTSYLKYLTSFIEEKEILFVPPSMAQILAEPDVIPFLMDNQKTILIIEDAESVISDRNGKGNSQAVSNILNLTDGILSDCLNIQIIATFNTPRENIDKALLRKGRLLAEYKFEPLSIEDSNLLLEELGKKERVDKPTKICDIYNIDQDEFLVSNNDKKIGF